MKRLHKFKPNYLFIALLSALLLCTLTWKTAARYVPTSNFYTLLTAKQDTIKPVSSKDSNDHRQNLNDTIPQKDSNSLSEKVDTFSLKLSKDSLEAPVKYQAQDSAVVLIKEKKILLYGKTRTEYKDITLTAPQVELNQQTQILTAVNRRDSDGAVIETAHFKQGDDEFTSDTIRYNFKTQIGLTKNTYTKQGDFFLLVGTAKKMNESTSFMKNVLFTTCNLDEPHFAIATKKMKVINKKLAVSGPAHLEFEGVPIPIYIPFGFYPLSQGRHSGFLPPQFTTNEQYGLGLEGIGYYKVLNDHWDTKVYGNIYSYGGWSMNINPTYRRRYKYTGAFTFSMQSVKLNFKGDPDFSKTKTYNILWSHSIDGRSRPGTSFSANVNAGSTKYNRFIPNNPQQNFQNQLGSSVTYSKTWKDKPFNLTMSANHNQNNFTHLINVSLPDVGFTVNTVYPFQKKDFVGSHKWYEKLGLAYSGTFRDQVSFYDTAFRFKQLIDTLQWGAQHNFPISLSLPPIFGGALIVAPSISYSQIWIAQKFYRKWNPTTKKVDTSITKGIFMDHSASFGLSLNTAIFGTFNFKNSRIVAIRHVIRPSFGFSFKPDLSKKHFYTVQVDTTNKNFYRFSEYEGSLFGYYSEGQYGGLTFQLDNNLEMKWRSKKDTGDNAIKKIRLIDGYGFSTGYNFFADSMKLAPFQIYFRTNLFEKFNITASTTLDPYQVNSFGRDISKYAWQGGKFKLGRFTTGSISMTTSFKSKPTDAKKEEERKKQSQRQLNDPTLIDDQRRLLDYMQQNPSQFVDFNIPWQLNLSYSLYFQEQLRPDFSGFDKKFRSNVNFNGSFNLTEKWNFGVNGYYDFDTKKLQTFQMSISREMHCWQMSINVTPVGLYKYFNFTISPKSSILQDLRINRTRYFTN